jgi:hypothetical protein
MSLRNYLKKLGKRAAGSWGRINHPLQMRAESKALRQHAKKQIKTSEIFERQDYDKE